MATSRVPVPPPPNVPATMEAAAIDRFGPPEVLTLHTLPVPELGPNEVLIALHAAGVGIWDAKIRDGTWATGKERFPLVLGTDGAGIVAAKGPHVRRFHVGDRVWAYVYENPKGGFYADFVAVDAQHVGRVPERLDLQHAGAAAVTGLTALQGIDEHLKVRAGETVLVFAERDTRCRKRRCERSCSRAARRYRRSGRARGTWARIRRAARKRSPRCASASISALR